MGAAKRVIALGVGLVAWEFASRAAQAQQWAEVGGHGLVKSNIVAVTRLQRIEIFAVGTDNNIYSNQFTPGPNTWTTWFGFGGSTFNGIAGMDGLVGGVDSLAVAGMDGRPYIQQGDSVSWSGWRPTPFIPNRSVLGTPAIAGRFPINGFQGTWVFAVASGGNLWRVQEGAPGAFGTWQDLGRPSGVSALSDVTVSTATFVSGTVVPASLEINVRGTNNAIWTRSMTANGSLGGWVRRVVTPPSGPGINCSNLAADRRAWNQLGDHTAIVNFNGGDAGCSPPQMLTPDACYASLVTGDGLFVPFTPIAAAFRPEVVHFSKFGFESWYTFDVKPDQTIWFFTGIPRCGTSFL